MPSAVPEAEEPIRRTPAQRAAEWRAARAEEAAELRRRAALDAAIVDALLRELSDLDQANRLDGVEGPARITLKAVMASVVRRAAPVIPREEMLRQLQARLAPGQPNPYAATSL
jgi:hypothetical protein